MKERGNQVQGIFDLITCQLVRDAFGTFPMFSNPFQGAKKG